MNNSNKFHLINIHDTAKLTKARQQNPSKIIHIEEEVKCKEDFDDGHDNLKQMFDFISGRSGNNFTM